MDQYRYKTIADPVHGTIGLSEIETRVVDTPSFQRLRRLKQLALAHLVFPTAGHSRFAHSLGVFHIMGRAIDTLIHKGHLKEEDKQKLRLAALLHDIGHYPYSHLIEKLDSDSLKPRWLGGPEANQPGEPYPRHEQLGRHLVMGRPDIIQTLSPGYDPEEIADIFCGEHSRAIYNGLIHSSLDLDRMDYLVRDAIATGVPLGRIDLEYLLSHLDADAEGRLGLEPKAATAAEHFMLARYFMSKVVYLHKTVFAFEALMRQIAFLLRLEGKLWRDGDAVKAIVGNDREFARFHDDYVDGLIDERAAQQDTLGLLCRSLRFRVPPVLLKDFRVLEAKDGSTSREVTTFRVRRQDHLQGLADKYEIPIQCFLWEDPKEVSLENVGPFVGITAKLADKDTEELLRIIQKDQPSRPLISDQNSLVHYLSHLRLRITRLYVVESDESKVAELKREIDGWTA